jgi:hypothetical protein
MSSTQDQPPRDPGRSGTAPGSTATEGATGMGGAHRAEATRGYVPRPTPGYDDVHGSHGRPSGAIGGLTVLAAVLMMLGGLWGFLEGLAAVIRGSFFVVLPNYAYSVSATSWGWIHLILGVLVAGAGLALLLKDSLWARITGIVLASFSTIANFMFIPYSPVWSIVVIAIDLAIIWALLTPRGNWA